MFDFGCGLGNLSLEAARRGHAVTAVDASSAAIAHIEHTAQRERLNLRTCLVDALHFSGCRSATDDRSGVPHDPTVACALPPAELQQRREQLIPGLLGRAIEVVDLEQGLRMRFKNRPGLLSELVGIIAQEQTCCSFLRFQITAEGNGGDVTFDVTGPPGTREMLRAL